jgi:hypothetical protein
MALNATAGPFQCQDSRRDLKTKTLCFRMLGGRTDASAMTQQLQGSHQELFRPPQDFELPP